MPFEGTIPQRFPHAASGATLVSFKSLTLGYSEDRVNIDEQPSWHDVHSDGFGGNEGPPCDSQYLGSVVFVRCLLNRFNEDNIRTLSRVDMGSPGGTLPIHGLYMRQDLRMYNLVLSSAKYVVTFAKAFLRQGRKWSMGSRHQSFALMFECHINDPCDYLMFTLDKDNPRDPCSPDSSS